MSNPNLTDSGRLRSVSERLRRIGEVPEDLNLITRVALEASLTENLDRAVDDLVVAKAEAVLLKSEPMVQKCSWALKILRDDDKVRDAVGRSVSRLEDVSLTLKRARDDLLNVKAELGLLDSRGGFSKAYSHLNAALAELEKL